MRMSQTQFQDDVLAERQRQVDVEGWTAAQDDEHQHGELAMAAACLCVDATDAEVILEDETLDGWGLAHKHHGDWRRQLVIAAALILAEGERLDRVRAATEASNQGAAHG